MNDDLKDQINDIIRDEIQDVINDYVDTVEDLEKENGGGFGKDELKINIPKDEVDKLIKEYKKIKKREKSNLHQVKKMGLVDKFGNPLK